MRFMRYMLIFVPIAVVAEFFIHNEMLIFVSSALALIPLAGLLGEATEELAVHTGPKIGGLLNATLGNAAELIITIVALQAGNYELVKASITGSIIGNLLLIMGFALLLGGLRHGVQRFDRGLAGMSASMMVLAVIGLMIPTLFELMVELQEGRLDIFDTGVQDPRLNIISLGVAGILIVIYVLSVVYQLRGDGAKGAGAPAAAAAAPSHSIATGAANAPHGSATAVYTVEDTTAANAAHAADAPQVAGETHTGVDTPAAGHHAKGWSVRTALAVLAVSTLVIVFMSEFLVGVVEPVALSLGVRELFLGSTLR